MADFETLTEQKKQEGADLRYSFDELLPQPDEDQAKYETRLAEVPADKLEKFQEEYNARNYSYKNLLPQEGEDQQTYEQRLSQVPSPQLESFQKEYRRANLIKEMQPQEDEDQSAYEKRLASYPEEELSAFQKEVEHQEQVRKQAEDVEWHRSKTEEQIKEQSGLRTGVEALGLSAAQWVGVAPLMKELASSEAAAFAKFKEWWDKIPEERRKGFWEHYNRNLNALTGFTKAYQEAAPVSSFVGSFVGAAPVAGKMLKGFSTPFKAAVADTAIGASMGVGESDARLNRGEYVDVLKDVGAYAAGGLVGGIVLRKAADAVVFGAQKLSKASSDYLVKQLPKVGQSVEEHVDELYQANIAKENALKKHVLTEKDKYPSFDFFRKVVDEEDVQALRSGLSKKQLDKFRAEAKRFGVDPVDADAFAAWSEVQRARKEFARFHTRKVDQGELDKLIQSDFDRVAKGFEWYRKAEYAEDLISSVINKHAENNWAVKMATYFADTRYVLAAIDNKWGTTLTPTLDNMSIKYNLYRSEVAAFQDSTTSLAKAARKNGLFAEASIVDEKTGQELKSNLLYSALSSEQVRSKLTAKQQQVVEGWRGLFEQMRQSAEDAGLKIAKRENYVPHATIHESEILRKIDMLIEKEPESKELKILLSRLVGKEIRNKAQLKQAISDIHNPDFRDANKLARASASFEREGQVPASIREMDVPTLAMRWANNTLRYAHVRDDLLRLRGLSEMIKSKDVLANRYVSNLISDVSGVRQGTFSNWVKSKGVEFDVAIQRRIDKSTNPVSKTTYSFVKRMPDMFDFLGRQIYRNYLGFNPRVVVQNLMQPVLMTQGELSGLSLNAGYAAKKLFKGYGAVAGLRMHSKDPQVWKAFLEQEGLKAPEFSGEMQDAIRSGLKSSLGDAYKFVTETIPMAAFSVSENVNRATSYFTGVSVGDDLIKALQSTAAKRTLTLDEKAAVDFIKMAQSGYRTKYRQVFKEWNEATTVEARKEIESNIRKMTGRYLAAKTQFNYNRMSLSQYGREFGFLFSMFTKWPSSIASDLVMKAKEQGAKGIGKTATQYLAPMIALMTLDSLVLNNAEEDVHGRTRYFVGPKGLHGVAPIGSVGDMAGRGLINSPILGIVGSTAKDLMNRDPDKLKGDVEKSFRAFAPFAAYARLILEDMDRMQGKGNPETIHKVFKGED